MRIQHEKIVRCPLTPYDRGWNAALRKCIAILCPQPPIEEERECTDIAATLRHLRRKGVIYTRNGRHA